MKYLVLCTFILYSPVVFGSFAPSVDDDLRRYENECSAATGASQATIEQVRKQHVIPDNEVMRKFSKCMLQKLNVMYSDGSINTDKSKYNIPSDTNALYLLTCENENGDNVEDRARNIMNCYLQAGQLVMALPKVRFEDIGNY